MNGCLFDAIWNASAAAYLHPAICIPQPQSDRFFWGSAVSLDLRARPLFTRGNVVICEGKGGGADEKEKEKEREPASEWNKIARERKKKTETLAICESGSWPNHSPQGPGTC